MNLRTLITRRAVKLAATRATSEAQAAEAARGPLGDSLASTQWTH